MENIYELLLNDSEMDESVGGTVGTLVRKIQDKLTIHKKWDTSPKNRIYEEKDLPKKKYKDIVNALHGLQEASNYTQYKVYWNKLCSLTGIEKNHTVIVSFKTSSEKDTNYVKIVWNVSKKKITIPNGSKLYHMSSVSNITSLEPAFKGKSPKGYLYSSPRVYFTIKKEMPKFAADYKGSENTTMYTPLENITSAYIDPLVPNFGLGAVFVETTMPIKVEKVLKEDKKKSKVKQESVVETMDEEPVFESLEEFMNYYGIEFADEEYDDYMESSVKEKLGETTRDIKNKLFNRKVWEDIRKNIKREEKEVKLSPREKDELSKNYKTISDSTVFPIYKKAYDAILRFFKISGKNVIVENIDINDDKASIRYSKSEPKKIIIPNDCQLLHVSPTKNITELKPSFRSRVKGKYLYPSKRVYFSIRKQVKGTKAGFEDTKTLYRYTPKEDIKTAYIDPACTDYSTGAIFVDTSFPIPVKDADTDKSKVKKESVDDILHEIKSSYDNGLLTESERQNLEISLLDKLLDE